MRAPSSTIRRAKALRRELTLPEVLLWQELRGSRFDGLRFRRQHPTGPYVLDFYCPAHKLAVEVDGMVHDLPFQARHDGRRDAWLSAQGIHVIRIPAANLLSAKRRADVPGTIAAAISPSTTRHAVPLARDAGEE